MDVIVVEIRYKATLPTKLVSNRWLNDRWNATYVSDDTRDGERATHTDVYVFGSHQNGLRLHNSQFNWLCRRSLTGRNLQSVTK